MNQYFLGANSSIQFAGVQYVLDSVVDHLLADSAKRFTYVEVAFFSRWFARQSPARQVDVVSLVRERRLQFANGGWCMHDEAAAHYSDMIDQTALGHGWLVETFGADALPTVGWQIDPFGHSSLTATLLGPDVGFQAVFLGRADYADLERRTRERQLEFRWQPGGASDAGGPSFVGMVLGSGGYGPPEGFRWDMSQDEPIDDDPESPDYNAPAIVDAFVRKAMDWAARFRGAGAGGDVAFYMGEDFNYQTGFWWRNLDALIPLVNADGRVRVFYSTPGDFYAAKRASAWGGEGTPEDPSSGLEILQDDLFPYADGPDAYWTGFYSSRSALKAYIRLCSGSLNAARQLAALTSGDARPLRPLAEALAVAQHHDAVAGTSQQHVACDYARMLSAGADAANGLLSARLSAEGETLTDCPLLNASLCGPSSLLKPGDAVTLQLWNPLAWPSTQPVRLPVPPSSRVRVTVRGADGARVPSQTQTVSEATRALRRLYATGGIGDEASGLDAAADDTGAEDEELLFMAQLPALGVVSYVLEAREMAASAAMGAAGTPELRFAQSPTAVGDASGLWLDAAGRLARLRSIAATASLVVYEEHDGSGGAQAGGAYIFRPVSAVELPLTAVRLVCGAVASEARMRAAPWAHVTLRVLASISPGPFALEIEYTLGPLPQQRNVSTSVALRIHTDIASGGELWTDANGWRMQRRLRDVRRSWQLNVTQPVAENYYPSLGIVALQDGDGAAIALVPDRAMGAASLEDGALEVMLHRRLFHDDGRGVGEPLNESFCACGPEACVGAVVRGTLRLTVADGAVSLAAAARPLQMVSERPALAFFSNSTAPPQQPLSFLATPLPPNVHLLTLSPMRTRDAIMLRLAHIYEPDGIGADANLSATVTLDLQAHLLRRIVSLTDLRLTGVALRRGPLASTTQGAWLVTLRAAEIVTLEVVFQPPLSGAPSSLAFATSR